MMGCFGVRGDLFGMNVLGFVVVIFSCVGLSFGELVLMMV